MVNIFKIFVANFVTNESTTTNSAMFQDVTGTTIYVVGVICVIPAAGLVAWVVRYVVRKKVILIRQSFSYAKL
jgi:hypothetical protein